MGLKSDPDVRMRDFVHDRIQALRRVVPGGVDFHDLGMGNTIGLYLGLVEQAQVALHPSAEVQLPFREVWVRRLPQVQWAYGCKQRIVMRIRLAICLPMRSWRASCSPILTPPPPPQTLTPGPNCACDLAVYGWLYAFLCDVMTLAYAHTVRV